MTFRLALRFILIALAAGFAVVTAGLALSRLREQTAAAPIDLSQLTEAQLASALMPLDANGVGSQVFGDTIVSVRVLPYPVAAPTDTEIRLVAVTERGRVLQNSRPTVFIARAGASDGATRALVEQPDGSYAVRGRLFGQPGLYRLRLTVPPSGRAPGGEFDYIVLLSLDVR